MPDQTMAERVTPQPKDTTRKPQVISMREYNRRKFIGKIKDITLAVAANKAAQTVIGVSAVGAAGKLAYDNWVVNEDQAEKMAKFQPKILFVGSATFIVGDSMRLRTEPAINESHGTNVINQVLKMGGREVKQGDKVVIENPLGIEIKNKSGAETTWLQIPNLERRNLGLRNLIVGYAPFNDGNEAFGSFHEITEVKDGFYRLKGHDPVPVNQTQIFKVNGK